MRHSSANTATPLTLALTAAAHEKLRRDLAMASRFRLSSLPGIAWSSDGVHVFAEGGDGAATRLYRSSDGGKTFSLVDDHDAHGPRITSDERWIVYSRRVAAGSSFGDGPQARMEVVALPVDGSRGPKAVYYRSFYLWPGLDGSGRYVVGVRTSTHQICADYVNPETAKVMRSFCVPARQDANVNYRPFATSPNGSYGQFAFSAHPKSYVTLVHLDTGQRLATIDVPPGAAGELDDRGRLLVENRTLGRAFVLDPAGERELGPGMALGWDPTGRALLFRDVSDTAAAATLGGLACQLVSVVVVP